MNLHDKRVSPLRLISKFLYLCITCLETLWRKT